MSIEQCDALIIGSGQAGTPLAVEMAKAGRKTVLVEREYAGGTCVNVGCTPTKTMVASARLAYLARRAADYGVQCGPVEVDMERVRERKRAIVDKSRRGNEDSLRTVDNLELVYGEARFTGDKTIEATGRDGSRMFRAESVFINTGARPAPFDVPGSDTISYLNSTSIMELDALTQHLVVVGGGYVGLEFAQMFRRFGSRVTIVERAPRLLAREDEDVSDAVADILREDGIEVLLEAEITKVRHVVNGIYSMVQLKDSQLSLVSSHLLAAAGRIPNTDMLNLPATGVEVDEKGFIPVNERLETNVTGIYALGDVHGGPAFTHISYDDFRIMRTNLLEGGQASTKGRMVPYVVYIDPQLGRVGLNEKEARAQGLDFRVIRMEMQRIARAQEMAEMRGFIKVLLDNKDDRVLGCAVLGVEGGEIMSALQLAMMGGLTCTRLRDAIFAHPTLMEGLNNVFMES